MPIKVTCPKCGGVLHAPDDAGGKKGRCPTCGTVLPIPAHAAAEEPGSAGNFRLRGGGGSDNPFPAANPFAAPPPPATPGKRSSMSPPMKFTDEQAPPEPRRMPQLPGRPKVPAPAASSTFGGGGPTETVPEDAAGWRRFARGLGWVRSGTVFLTLAVVAPAGVALYEQFAGPLPDKNPGYLGKPNLAAAEEIRAAAALVPAALGLLFAVVGRVLAARPPAVSAARGLMTLSALGAVAAVGALAAAVLPTALGVLQHGRPNDLADLIQPWQRVALAAAVALAVVAESWMASGLGRVGVALSDPRPAGRATRFLALVGAAAVAAVAGYGVWAEYPAEVNNWLVASVQPSWDGLADKKPAARAGAAVGAAVVLGLLCLRLTGGAKRAVRDWLAQQAAPGG